MFARNECITVCFDFSNDLWLQLCRKNGLSPIRYIIRYVRISLSEHNAKYSFVTFFFSAVEESDDRRAAAKAAYFR